MELWIGKRITLFYKDGVKTGGEAHVSKKTGILLSLSNDFIVLLAEQLDGSRRETSIPRENLVRGERAPPEGE
jgi:hypothetical protein